MWKSCSSSIIEDPNEISNKFNDYLINIGPNLAKKSNTTKMSLLKNILNGCYQTNFFLSAITKHELELELESIKLNKSCGYDGINANIIKVVAKEVSEPLTHIFNF